METRTVYAGIAPIGTRHSQESAWNLALWAAWRYGCTADVYIGNRRVASVEPDAPELADWIALPTGGSAFEAPHA